MAITDTYAIRTTGDTETINNPSFIVRAIRIVNHSGDTVLLDNRQDQTISVPPGTSPVFNQHSLISTFYLRTASKTTGNVQAIVYDTPQDESTNTALQQLPGTIDIGTATVVIQSGTVDIGTAPPVTVAPGQNIGVTTLPNVQLSPGQTVNVGTLPAVQFATAQTVGVTTLPAVQVSPGQSITSIPSGTQTVVSADVIATYQVIDNNTANVVLTRQSFRVTIQPIIGTLVRGGILSIYATDSTTQTYEFIEKEPIQFGTLAPLSPIIPYAFDCTLKAGAVLHVRFTGSMGFIIAY